ncbi:B12-binding domain-containing radical SAM protein [Proteocatella sphenisci]|uniref:B12-binding domain-containing radical SAM protein n=1 Tax=Proteocatella sphenisci TaxID=181070 RepID=UPI00048B34D6|nr:B12-binding domain-containing radical SAM protein [Proteocatella sphenisci]
MKVLLIRPRPDKETIGLQHVMICEPLELEYLVSNIPENLKSDVDIKIYDFILETKSFKDMLKEENPDFVAFTAYITHVETVKNLAKEVKSFNPNIFTAVGGVHAEVVGDDFLDSNIDFIYRKNGIDGFNSTLDGILKILDKNQIKEAISLIEKKPFEYNYNHPDRQAVERYRKNYYYMFHNPCSLIKTSYGCPYDCSFCFCKEITGGKYFTRDIEDVVDEISKIKEKEIYIVDDDFLFGEDRLRKFIALLKEKKIEKNYLVYGRADFVAENRELLAELKQVGLRAVIVGIESIRKEDLKTYNKKTTVDINESCIQILRELDIELYATMILPMDFTKKDFRDLAKWLTAMKVTFVNLQPLTPIPGTDIFKDYEKHLLVPRQEYTMFDMAHVILKPSHMSVRQFYIEILKGYYKVVMRPKNSIRLLKKYGLKENIKMLKGSQKVSLQYLKKIIRG